ncbi:MAG TPA: isoprenylcysteine carboxylmethyltransferase family protein [Gemmatimonadaceae bacterium]|nr:isoprenylcysteine carboxylmethyltransferase family protein [Gemmatimonadaceae bacterium]
MSPSDAHHPTTAAGTAPRASAPGPLVRYGNFMFRWRNTIFPVVLLALFLAFRPRYLAGSERADHWLDALGVLVILAGQALRVAVIGYVYIIRGGRHQRVYAEDLVTGGFFAHARNPLYLGNLLVLFGLFLIHNNPWVYAIGVPFFVLGYVGIVAAEEHFLRGKFGAAYDAYARDVPRWIPRLGGLRASLAGMRFNWRRVVLKEYGSTYAWILGVVVLLAYETLTHHAYAERAHFLDALWATFGVATVAYGVVRYLKLSRKLREAPA